MKVLLLCQRIVFFPEKSGLAKTTGYSYIMQDIIEGLPSEDVCVDVLAITDEKIKAFEKSKILTRSILDVFRHLQFKDVLNWIKTCQIYKPTVRMSFTYLYYYLSKGYIRFLLSSNEYDLVHVHGLGVCGQTYIDCCRDEEVPTVLTLHALYSDMPKTELLSENICIDTKMDLEYIKNYNGVLTVISNGMKKQLVPFRKNEPIEVILNGARSIKSTSLDIRMEYDIADDSTILIRVGNISERKNQKELVEAVINIIKEKRANISLLLLGEDYLGGQLQRVVEETHMEKHIIFCGNISRDLLGNYYEVASGNIVNSIDEGFGLSVIEAGMFGVPTLMYDDLAAYDDFDKSGLVFPIHRESIPRLEDSIVSFVNSEKQRDKVIEESKKYSVEAMTDDYRRLYRRCIYGECYDS